MTCPFIGAAIATGDLPLLGSKINPLSSVDAVTRLGNTGPDSTLGEVLKVFAHGNHAKMRSDAAAVKLTATVPQGYFSLDFPGSQGSHPGDSGILQGQWDRLESGRWDQGNWDRLLRHAKDGFLSTTGVGNFIAENLRRDPASKVADLKFAKLFGGDLAALAGAVGNSLLARITGNKGADREVLEALTKAAGENNLVGSAGEFGLLFALLDQTSREVEGAKAINVAEAQLMFKDKRFPQGWLQWHKSGHTWVLRSTQIAISAAKAYHRAQ